MAKGKGGRPTMYTEKLAEEICRAVATHAMGLQKICSLHPHFPTKTTINEWRLDNTLFAVKYAKAKLAQADLLAEELLDISDNCKYDTITDKDGKEMFNGEYVARSRLRVDTRKWLASKLVPRTYGDTVKIENSISTEKSAEQVQATLKKIKKHAKEY